MSNNQMVSVPRELVEFAVGFKRNGHKNLTDQRSDQDNAQDKLRALLERPADQHQVEPVGYVRAGNLRNLRLVAHCAAIEMTGVPRRDGDIPLYTHADPAEVVGRLKELVGPAANDERIALRAEVERLTRKCQNADLALAAQTKQVHNLRAQLAERDALLGAIAGWTTETRAAVLEAFQDELNESASYAWYDAAIADLMKLVEALSASAEPSASVELKAPELTEDLREILGRPNFTCHFIAKALRVMGHSIAHKSEDEQAVVIHWLLGIYLKHGPDWRQRAAAELEEASQSLNT